MRGRPRKVYLNSDVPVQLAVRVPKYIRDAIPPNVNMSREIETFLRVKYSEPGEAELQSLRLKEMELREELIAITGKIRIIEEKQRQREELLNAIKFQRDYSLAAFKKIIAIEMKGHPLDHRISMKIEAIISLFGIEFDKERLNKEFDEFLERMADNSINDDEIISRYNLKKVQKGERENEIIKEAGLEPKNPKRVIDWHEQ